MHVVLILPPVVTVTSYPLHYATGDTVTFTGHLPSNTNGYSYQWRKNGVDIPGANFSIYTTNQVHAGDTICLVVRSTVPCTIPDSTVACVGLTLNVNSVKYISNVLIYPNPVSNELVIEGAGEGTGLKVFNIIGQLMYSGNADNDKTTINTAGFCKGTYILELTDAEGERVMKKIVKY